MWTKRGKLRLLITNYYLLCYYLLSYYLIGLRPVSFISWAAPWWLVTGRSQTNRYPGAAQLFTICYLLFTIYTVTMLLVTSYSGCAWSNFAGAAPYVLFDGTAPYVLSLMGLRPVLLVDGAAPPL